MRQSHSSWARALWHSAIYSVVARVFGLSWKDDESMRVSSSWIERKMTAENTNENEESVTTNNCQRNLRCIQTLGGTDCSR